MRIRSSTVRARRLIATGIDYTCIGVGVAMLFGAVRVSGVDDRLGEVSPAVGQWVGFVALTIPATVLMSVLERAGGTPGKRLMGLRLTSQDQSRPTLSAAVMRSTGKIAVPWELAHAGVWQFVAGNHLAATLLIGTSYVVLGLGVAQLLRTNLPWYDRLAHTEVISRQ